ncbi:transporter substrate-binding domain-containing protein [Aliiglaciecola sp. CAU 1673]|uniref:substrate-binding periplasmic protein n=1 Tax=Aliiglaciecola sp. CAU 1673 TaxID=3032595 RepID=UPI0023DB0A63|nr:transporter substrate-binding domain-containing protein [Aliiglaciecola sp. CAU 1673]MDF2179384.1 transporter substrate-binding domain-containing protein [Aliiglaciecola sp. CAU 1673]
MLLLFLFFCGLNAAHSAEPKLLVVTESLPPFQIQRAGGNIEGIATNKVRQLLSGLALDAEIEMMPWARAYLMAQSEPNVLIYSIVRTPFRENLFHWIGVLVSTKTHFIALRDRQDIHITDVDDLSQYRIAVKRDDVITEWLERSGIRSNLVQIKNTQSTLAMLLLGRVDLIPGSKIHIEYMCQLEGCTLDQLAFLYEIKEVNNDFYLAASLGTPLPLVETLRTALSAINAEE